MTCSFLLPARACGLFPGGGRDGARGPKKGRRGPLQVKMQVKMQVKCGAGRTAPAPKKPAPKKPAPEKPRPEKAPLRKSPPRKSLPRKSPATAKKQRPGQTAGALPLCCEKNQSSRLPNSLRRRSGLCSSAQVMAQGEVNSSSLFPFRSSMRRVSLVRSRFLGSRSSLSIQRMCS